MGFPSVYVLLHWFIKEAPLANSRAGYSKAVRHVYRESRWTWRDIIKKTELLCLGT